MRIKYSLIDKLKTLTSTEMDLWPGYIIRMYAGQPGCVSSPFILLCMDWSVRGL